MKKLTLLAALLALSLPGPAWSQAPAANGPPCDEEIGCSEPELLPENGGQPAAGPRILERKKRHKQQDCTDSGKGGADCGGF